jgi:hypothetical protein
MWTVRIANMSMKREMANVTPPELAVPITYMTVGK